MDVIASAVTDRYVLCSLTCQHVGFYFQKFNFSRMTLLHTKFFFYNFEVSSMSEISFVITEWQMEPSITENRTEKKKQPQIHEETDKHIKMVIKMSYKNMKIERNYTQHSEHIVVYLCD